MMGDIVSYFKEIILVRNKIRKKKSSTLNYETTPYITFTQHAHLRTCYGIRLNYMNHKFIIKWTQGMKIFIYTAKSHTPSSEQQLCPCQWKHRWTQQHTQHQSAWNLFWVPTGNQFLIIHKKEIENDIWIKEIIN